MKTIEQGHHSTGHASFNQLPIPNDIVPPFKPLNQQYNDYPSYNIPFGDAPSPPLLDSYGGPFNPDHYEPFGQSTDNRRPTIADPNAYDTYHTMKLTKEKKSPPSSFGATKFAKAKPINYAHKGLEITKSIGYEIKA